MASDGVNDGGNDTLDKENQDPVPDPEELDGKLICLLLGII